jgi:hypothetical protein
VFGRDVELEDFARFRSGKIHLSPLDIQRCQIMVGRGAIQKLYDPGIGCLLLGAGSLNTGLGERR